MMFQRVGMLDTHIALILCYTVVNLPIVVWLMHDFFVSIPIDLEESAQLDGASRLTIDHRKRRQPARRAVGGAVVLERPGCFHLAFLLPQRFLAWATAAPDRPAAFNRTNR